MSDQPASARGPDRRSRGRTSPRHVAVRTLTLVLLAVLDLAIAPTHHEVWTTCLFYTVAILAAIRRLIDPHGKVNDTVAFAAVSGTSAGLTAFAAFTHWTAFGPGEALLLLVILLLIARRLAPSRAIALGILTTIATISSPLRDDAGLSTSGSTLAVMIILALLAAVSLTLGLYLRGLDTSRTDAIARARATERADMAAELHDFVAHHVTGILAQAQMGQMVLDSKTGAQQHDQIRGLLVHIETAASDALDSMRRTVHLLRDSGLEPQHAPRSTDDLAALTDLITSWQPTVQFNLGADITSELPRPIQAATFRVVREALTNTRKHAPHATEISVDLTRTTNALYVTITNNGATTSTKTGSRGLGLIGLRERVTALGGDLYISAPTEDIWVLRARLLLTPRTPTDSLTAR